MSVPSIEKFLHRNQYIEQKGRGKYIIKTKTNPWIISFANVKKKKKNQALLCQSKMLL